MIVLFMRSEVTAAGI